MEKRLLLAVLLTAAVFMVTNLLFPPPEVTELGDQTGIVGGGITTEVATGSPTPFEYVEPAEVTGDSVVVDTEVARYVFASRGAALRKVYLRNYLSYGEVGEPVQLVPSGVADFLGHLLVAGNDTIDLRSAPFTSSLVASPDGSGSLLRFAFQNEGGLGVQLEYTFTRGEYLVSARGEVTGLNGRSARFITLLGPRLEMHEHPEHHSEQEFAVVLRRAGKVERLPFRKVEGREAIESELSWAGLKDKYFLGVILASEGALHGAVLQEVPHLSLDVEGKEVRVPQVELMVGVPVESQGQFAYEVYLGPQDYGLLAGIGQSLEDVTPYGYRWLQPVIRPLAAAVLWVLSTLHDTLGIAYGWVLVLFGVLMRVVLWPLNAKAMRSQMKNMAVQPLLTEIREKYKNDPQKQQEAMLSLYKEHGFNPLAGCLPMLVPFPVLITLFFVFRNTIALRGAEFLWLPDLSLKDPFYILPAILVISMFGLQWVSAHLSGMEQNPQMKTMMYFMPIMMGMIFFMLPAGLNLYYAVTQVASLPQQILIAQERRRAQEEVKKSAAPKLTKASPARRKR